MSSFPSNLRYTKEHEWARPDGELIRVGITAYAVEQLGDITLVDLPESGSGVTGHERFGDIESVKTVSELFAPISGEIVEINNELENSPELVNEDPYNRGWLVAIRPTNPSELEELLDAANYESYLGTIDG